MNYPVLAGAPVKATVPLKTSQKNLSESQQLLAAITALTKAIQGTNLVNINSTQTPPTAPKAQQISLAYRSRTISAGSNFTEYFTGNFFLLYSNSNANQSTTMFVAFNDDAQMAFPKYLKAKTSYTKIKFFNNDTNPATIVYFIGNGDFDFQYSTN